MKHATRNTKYKIQSNCRRRMFHVSCFMFHDFRASRENGYTLLEMLTVLAIIALLSTVILTNYTKNRQSEILLNETYKISQLIRRAQNLALSPQYGGGSRNGFGVYFQRSTNTVILFANIGAGNIYNAGDEIIEQFSWNSQVKISELRLPANDAVNNRGRLDILYIPPDPETKITATGGVTDTTAKIVIALADSSKSRAIEVNATGLVEVK